MFQGQAYLMHGRDRLVDIISHSTQVIIAHLHRYFREGKFGITMANTDIDLLQAARISRIHLTPPQQILDVIVMTIIGFGVNKRIDGPILIMVREVDAADSLVVTASRQLGLVAAFNGNNIDHPGKSIRAMNRRARLRIHSARSILQWHRDRRSWLSWYWGR